MSYGISDAAHRRETDMVEKAGASRWGIIAHDWAPWRVTPRNDNDPPMDMALYPSETRCEICRFLPPGIKPRGLAAAGGWKSANKAESRERCLLLRYSLADIDYLPVLGPPVGRPGIRNKYTIAPSRLHPTNVIAAHRNDFL